MLVLDKGSNSFLKLLHVAIYESALQFAPDSTDLLSLHLILTRLVHKLNINAVVSGLPMIYKLQSDIAVINDRKSQVALSSLIAGYLLTIGENFGLEDLREGVGMEITHRKEHGQWFDGISIPAQEIPATPAFPPEKAAYLSSDPILPFNNKYAVVNDICDAAVPTSTEQRAMLLADWSKEAVLSELETNSSKQASVAESRLGHRTGACRNYLTVNSGNGHPGSLNGGQSHHNSRPGSKHGAGGGPFRLRAQTTGGSTSRSSSSRSWTIKVDELKAVLNGQDVQDAHNATSMVDDSSSASECQSYTSSDGEGLIVANEGVAAGGSGRFSVASSNGIGLRKKRSSSMPGRRDEGEQVFSRGRADSHIPPVPRLPSMKHGTFSGDEDFFGGRENGHSKSAAAPSIEEHVVNPVPTSPGGFKFSQQHQQHHGHHVVEGFRPGTGKLDVQSFLSGIDVHSSAKKRPGSSRGVFKPPY